MNRRLAREEVFLLIFGYVFTKERDLETEKLLLSPDLLSIDEELSHELRLQSADLSEDDRTYVDDTYDGVIKHYADLTAIIAKYAVGFDVKRIFKPDFATLLLAVYEMKYNVSVPLGVAIAEAVAIVKKYSTTKSNAYVNGILASFYRDLDSGAIRRGEEEVCGQL